MLVATLATAGVCRAQDVAASTERAFAGVTVDGVDDGERTILVIPGDVLLDVADARALDVPVTPDALRTLGPNRYVSLHALAPEVTYRFDEEAVSLTIDVAARLLETKTTRLGQSAPSDVDTARPGSAFGNYFVSGTSGSGIDAFLEAGYSRGNHLLYTSESLATGTAALHGETYYAIDDPARTRRSQIGDSTAYGDALLGDVNIFGIGTRRAFELDPYVYRFPTPAISGTVATPATADVYINGTVARSVPLAPGGFNLTDLPIATGRNNVRVVVHDAAGRVQTFSQGYYASDTLLRKGLTDDQFAAGFMRSSGAGQSYGKPAVVAAYRIGATDAATYGVRFEGTGAHELAELNTDLRVPSGAVHLAAAQSSARGRFGMAYDVAAIFQGAKTSFAVDLSSHATAFADLTSLPEILSAPRSDARFTLSRRLTPALTATLQTERQTYDAIPGQTIDILGLQSQMGRDTTAFVSLQHQRAGFGQAITYASLSIVRALGANRTAIASYDGGTPAATNVQYRADPPSSDTGFGYGLRFGRAGSESLAQLDLVDHARYGDTQGVLARDSTGKLLANVAFDGGVSAIGGKTLFSRPIADGFALVETGAPNVPVTLDGRAVGRTDRTGDLVVSSLASNSANRLEVDPQSLPLGEEPKADERLVSPGFRGGTVADLQVARIRYFIGSVRFRAGAATQVPADGMLVLSGKHGSARSPLDDGGGYYFENLAPGAYAATVRSPVGNCRFTLQIPVVAKIATDLGIVRCDVLSS